MGNCHQHAPSTPGGTTIVNKDNDAILKVNFGELPKDQQTPITKATEEFHEKCLLSYSRTLDSVVQKTTLPSVLLHGQSEEAKARVATQLVNKTVHQAFTNTIRCWSI